MPMFSPKNVVVNWYKYDVAFSMELIRTYITSVERQVSESILSFQSQKDSFILDDVPEDTDKESYCRVVDVHQGLDSQSWDLDGVFTEYFPNLQRKSALLTLTGYFEHELDKLCRLYQEEKSYSLSLSDLGGKGIDRAVNYLNKVAGLNVSKTSQEWNDVKKVQKVRNVIVHQDGKLTDAQGNPIKEVINYATKSVYLSGKESILICDGFLFHVAALYESFFKLIESSINEKQSKA